MLLHISINTDVGLHSECLPQTQGWFKSLVLVQSSELKKIEIGRRKSAIDRQNFAVLGHILGWYCRSKAYNRSANYRL